MSPAVGEEGSGPAGLVRLPVLAESFGGKATDMSAALTEAVDFSPIQTSARAALIHRLEDFDFQTGIVVNVAQQVGIDLEGMFDDDQTKAERFDKAVRAVRDQVVDAVKTAEEGGVL